MSENVVCTESYSFPWSQVLTSFLMTENYTFYTFLNIKAGLCQVGWSKPVPKTWLLPVGKTRGNSLSVVLPLIIEVWRNLPLHGSSSGRSVPLSGTQTVSPSQIWTESVDPKVGAIHWYHLPHSGGECIQSHTWMTDNKESKSAARPLCLVSQLWTVPSLHLWSNLRRKDPILFLSPIAVFDFSTFSMRFIPWVLCLSIYM